MNSQKFTHLLLRFLLVATLPALAGCRLGRSATPTPMPLTLPGQYTANAVATGPLETYTVQRGEVVQEELFSGRVTPTRQEDLFFRRSGQVTDVYVENGAHVQAGDIIAILDNDILELDLESALIGLAIAQQSLSDGEKNLDYRRRQLELNLEISKLLITPGTGQSVDLPSDTPLNHVPLIRNLQLELAQLNLDQIDDGIDPVLELNVKRAEIAVDRVKQSILEGQIEAPFDGEIRFINLPERDEPLSVAGYAAVARLVDISQFKIELNLARTQLESLTEGMSVEISAATLGGRTLAGVIEALPRPFGTSQGSLTEIRLADAADNSQLREGITVAVNARLKSKPTALVIPRIALQQENELYYVTVQEGELLRRVSVAIGVLGSDLVEITAGLEEGQTVVVGQ
ncbi:MAG: HlyD family efflux transporter periplasmic adaptor subunit [Caldilineaceae bacterium]|nr:HlyD family efflux transporter periplasmic adaptor subunit [Caldilineaceae bacterium]